MIYRVLCIPGGYRRISEASTVRNLRTTGTLLPKISQKNVSKHRPDGVPQGFLKNQNDILPMNDYITEPWKYQPKTTQQAYEQKNNVTNINLWNTQKILQTSNTTPYHPCMVYLTTFTIKINKCTMHGWYGHFFQKQTHTSNTWPSSTFQAW